MAGWLDVLGCVDVACWEEVVCWVEGWEDVLCWVVVVCWVAVLEVEVLPACVDGAGWTVDPVWEVVVEDWEEAVLVFLRVSWISEVVSTRL